MPEIESVTLGDLKCWRLHDGETELLVAEQGAQVLSYHRKGEEPLIWLNQEAVFKPGKSIRTGAPVCWPWFGDLKRNPANVQAMCSDVDAAPFHGLVRTLPWERVTADGPQLVFRLPQARGQLPGWPHDVELTLVIEMTEHLTLRLTSQNCGNSPVSLSQALHTYYAVSDVRQVTLEGVASLSYIDTLEDWGERAQSGELTFEGETDRIYRNTPSALAIVDANWQRKVLIAPIGSSSAIVWNPWIDKTATLPDMGDDDWQRMLCVETANVLDDVVTLAPGESHTLGFQLSTEKL